MIWSILPDDLTRIRAALVAGPRAETPPAPTAWGMVSVEAEESDDRPYRMLPDGTAVVSLVGPLYAESAPWWLVWATDGTTYGRVIHAVTRAVDDPLVQRVVLDVDSPGGMVTGVVEAAAALREIAARKPVVAYARGYCASAAYWLASQCNEVTASPTAGVGSIGVVVHIYDRDRMLSDAGVDHYVVTNSDSPRKAPDLSDEDGRADVQRMCDVVADAFYAAVATGRGVDDAWARESMGRGAVLVGADALAARLIDRVVVGPEAACSEPEDDATAEHAVDAPEVPSPGAAGRTLEVSMAQKGTPAAEIPTATDTRDEQIAALIAERATVQAALDAERTVREQMAARLEAAEAKIAEREQADRAASIDAMLSAHVERGAILPAARSQWAATAEAMGVEATDALLKTIPAATARPVALIAPAAGDTTMETREQFAAEAQRVAKADKITFGAAMERLAVTHKTAFARAFGREG